MTIVLQISPKHLSSIQITQAITHRTTIQHLLSHQHILLHLILLRLHTACCRLVQFLMHLLRKILAIFHISAHRTRRGVRIHKRQIRIYARQFLLCTKQYRTSLCHITFCHITICILQIIVTYVQLILNMHIVFICDDLTLHIRHCITHFLRDIRLRINHGYQRTILQAQILHQLLLHTIL